MAGVYLFAEANDLTRVSVFIDYQNVYHGAREAFAAPTGPREPPTFGHVLPLRLGILLKQLGETIDPARELEQVSLYKGMPTSKSHPKLQSSAAKQAAQWRAIDRLVVKTRPLRYSPIGYGQDGKPNQWSAEEKGIDVLLALDLAIGARDDLYDVGIVVSADTDLIPAMEVALAAGKRLETATWSGPYERGRPLKVPDVQLWNHKLDLARFQHVRDDTDYLAS